MKENVIDVLMYLFQNYLGDSDAEQSDRDDVRLELLEVGFMSTEIKQAFEWLDGLVERLEIPLTLPNEESAFRIYSDLEMSKLNVDCRGYLAFLEQVGILDGETRELVIDRVLALGGGEIDLTDLKWIVLMVLFSHPEQQEAYAFMEDLLFDEETVGYRH